MAHDLLHAMLVTGIVAFLDAYACASANAGHPLPLWVDSGGNMFVASRPADVPLGISADFSAPPIVLPIPPDTLVVLYTDGTTERARDQFADEERLRGAAVQAYQKPRADAPQHRR